ncbi:UNVERIFIED_CONTAM: hypothetical protein H355_000663 [Colinus virginianus]|nr:hypothetical protein H355_000663 [Colinus virginianus]
MSSIVTQRGEFMSSIVTQRGEFMSSVVTQRGEIMSSVVTQRGEFMSSVVTQRGEFMSSVVTQRGEFMSSVVTQRGEIMSSVVTQRRESSSAPLLSHPTTEPRVRVSALQSGSVPQSDRLACSVSGFYPPEIEVKWFHNGKEQWERVVSTDVVRNGDWTYQVLLLLDTGPQRRGDTYVCHVEHASLLHPKTQPWEPPVGTGRSELLVGVGGLVVGFTHVLLGLLVFLCAKKGERWGGGGPCQGGRADAQCSRSRFRAPRSNRAG